MIDCGRDGLTMHTRSRMLGVMDAFNTIADPIGNLAAVVAAVGVLFVNAKLDRLIGRV